MPPSNYPDSSSFQAFRRSELGMTARVFILMKTLHLKHP
jgi:hypothetical protein